MSKLVAFVGTFKPLIAFYSGLACVSPDKGREPRKIALRELIVRRRRLRIHEGNLSIGLKPLANKALW